MYLIQMKKHAHDLLRTAPVILCTERGCREQTKGGGGGVMLGMKKGEE